MSVAESRVYVLVVGTNTTPQDVVCCVCYERGCRHVINALMYINLFPNRLLESRLFIYLFIYLFITVVAQVNTILQSCRSLCVVQ